jgi:hypothetical protein
MAFLRRRWPIIFLALLPLIPLWRAVFLGEAIGPFDQIRQMGPWFAAPADRPWDVLQVDGALQFYTWRGMVLESWRHDELPLWNPYQLAGTPLLANSQSAGFYPPQVLLGLLRVPTSPAHTLLAWFHLFWAGFGLYALVRTLGGTRTGGALAGASFTLSAFMLGWTSLASVIATCSWIPWVLAGVAGTFAFHPRFVRDSRPYDRSAWILAGAAGMMALSGHLQFVAYGFLAAGFLALALAVDRLWQRERVPELEGAARRNSHPGFGPLARTVACLLFGLVLALPQLLPVLSFGEFSHRRGSPTEAGYEAYVFGALRPFELANVPHATLLGNPRVWSLHEDPVSSYWPQYAVRGKNFAEGALALSPLVLGLLFLAPWRRGAAIGLGALGLVALLLAFGTPLNRLLYFYMPGWSATGSPGRAIVLFVLAACALAGLAVGHARSSSLGGGRRPLLALLPAVLSVPFVLLASRMAAEAPEGLDDRWFAGLVSGSLVQAAATLLFAVIVSGAALYVLLKPGDVRGRAFIAFAPVLIAATSYAAILVPTGAPLASAAGIADRNVRVAPINEAWSLVAPAPALFPPNSAGQARLLDLSGYDSLIHRETVALLAKINGEDPAPPANGNMMFVKPRADFAGLVEAGVSRVISLRPVAAAAAPSATDGIIVYDLAETFPEDAVGRAVLMRDGAPVSGAVRFEGERESYDRIALTVQGPGRLILRDRMMLGWRATLDGRPARIDGGAWRELEVPDGEHRVEFRYVPPGLLLGASIGLPAWLLWIALGAITIFRTKPESK